MEMISLLLSVVAHILTDRKLCWRFVIRDKLDGKKKKPARHGIIIRLMVKNRIKERKIHFYYKMLRPKLTAQGEVMESK